MSNGEAEENSNACVSEVWCTACSQHKQRLQLPWMLYAPTFSNDTQQEQFTGCLPRPKSQSGLQGKLQRPESEVYYSKALTCPLHSVLMC